MPFASHVVQNVIFMGVFCYFCFLRWETEAERISNLPFVIEIVNGVANIGTQV